MRVFKKALLIILILCITCTSTPIYAFGELINQEKEISENRKLEVTEEKSSQDGNVSPFVEENKTPEIGEENLPVTDENKIPETSETEKNNATDTEKNKTITEDENEKSGKEVAEEKEIVTEESLESVLERRKSILEGDILSKKNKSVSNETKKAASTLFRSISMSIQDFLDNITKNTKFNKEDNKLHFIIKHWHHNQMTKNEGSEEKEETNDSEKLVTIEGYIEKKENESGYKIEIRKDTGSYTSITNENKGDCSDYVENVDTTNGTITFKANPLQQDGKPLEHFTAFAVGAGRKAVDENEEQEKVTVSYKEDTHLVKIHTYYVNENMIVAGSSDKTVFGTTEGTGSLEKDTAMVYTYINDKDNTHKAGDIVKTEEGKAVYEGQTLPTGVNQEDVQLTKVYSTVEGLHTDKSISKTEDDDRKFTIDLESWFSGAKAANIGLLLDASGSMTFTSDTLDPININNRDINLTSQEKAKLKAKALTKGNFPTAPETAKDWEEEVFLTQEEVNEILNNTNTDNNPLSDSGYNYYVFNESEDVNEYAPLGYWDGSTGDKLQDSLIGYYEFNQGNYTENNKRDWLKNSVTGKEAELVNQISADQMKAESEGDVSFEIANKPDNWRTDERISMKNGKGLTVKNLTNGVGVLLDAKPSSNNFTISFTVEKDSGTNDTNSTEAQNYTDLIYVGGLENIKSNKSDYYRLVREGAFGGATSGNGNSRNRLKGYKYENTGEFKTENMVTNLNSVFKGNTIHTITIVFKDNTVTSYMDGKKDEDTPTTHDIQLNGNNIVITGFDNDYNGANLYIDNVRVYDAALDADDVARIKNNTKTTETKKEYTAYNKYDEKEVRIATTQDRFVDPVKGGMNGWYYVNHDSDWDGHYINDKIESAKVLWGVSASTKDETITYTDTITSPTGVEPSHNGTEYTYTPQSNSPTLFYIDENGYLCCFYTRGTHQEQTGASYVYKKDDSADIKVESLQRAIGSFASKLDEASPDSKVSAVRYNLDLEAEDKTAANDYDKFVLLDWTNDPDKIQNCMSLDYGTGGTIEGTPSYSEYGAVTQYNYGVTGGTSTYVGFKAYEQVLEEGIDDNADKYLIVFTDGKDTSNETQRKEIEEAATKLKDEGYTIMAVMLTGGSIEYDQNPDSEYQQAKTFLLSFIGTKNTTADDAEKYFFSTEEVDTEGSNTIDELTNIFTNDILEQIADNLTDYTTQDYIDPRFNLISSTGREYDLGANGIVTILDTTGETYAKCDLITGSKLQEPKTGNLTISKEKDKNYVTIKLSDDVDVDAPTARLFYDSDKDMYYLKWVNQTIPGCVPEVNRLSVWNARFTVKAKDDFIGGNAVLTNGNDEKMNYVYKEGDTDASSGIDDYLRVEKDELAATTPTEPAPAEPSTSGTTEPGDEGDTAGESETKENPYPSKGFPRVTANIPAPTFTKEQSKKIYMGEKISYDAIKQEIIDELNKTSDPEEEMILYYLDYLERYEKVDDKDEKLLEKLLKEKTLTIPYSYLPNESKTNSTGEENHKNDVLGQLVYTIKEPDLEDGEIMDTEKRELTLTVEYQPANVETRLEKFNNLITDTDYKYDQEYKPVTGEVQTEETVITDKYTIDIVSGEVALQVLFDNQLVEILKGQEINYSVDLYRNSNGLMPQKIGTFNATYNGIDEIDTDDDGNYILKATLTYDKSFENYKTTGLPLGTYTLGDPEINSPKYIKFEGSYVVKEGDKYNIPNLFTVGTDFNDPSNHLAKFVGDTDIILGNTTDGEEYLNERFGLFEVKPVDVFELPLTGSNSLVILYIVIGSCVIAATVLHFSVKLRRKED